MSAAIETTKLTKRYGPVAAVADLDLSVRGGRVFGFLGPNGAGKTTTIRMLLALQQPTSGRASVFGLDAGRDAVEIHRMVGYLPGELALYPRLTARQHIDFIARARGERRPAFAYELVERLGVVIDRPCRDLSKGNRQKVGIVLAFMHHPELLILDEPTSGLDPLMQREFERLIREVVDEGRTVFLSSHELDEVQRLADHVAIIKAGRLVAVDTVEALRERSPLKVDAVFSHDANRSMFTGLDGVAVTSCEGPRISLEVPKPSIGKVLRLIADHDPMDVISRHADLDELFLDFYRDTEPSGDAGAPGWGSAGTTAPGTAGTTAPGTAGTTAPGTAGTTAPGGADAS